MTLNLPGQKDGNIFGHAREFDQGFQTPSLPRAMSIPGTAFVNVLKSEINRSDVEGSVGIPAAGEGGVSTQFQAPLILPHQATITSIIVIGTIAAAETWSLYKFQITGTPTGFAALVTGNINTKKENISIVIDNENFCYFLTTSKLTIDNDVLQGALLEFTS